MPKDPINRPASPKEQIGNREGVLTNEQVSIMEPTTVKRSINKQNDNKKKKKRKAKSEEGRDEKKTQTKKKKRKKGTQKKEVANTNTEDQGENEDHERDIVIKTNTTQKLNRTSKLEKVIRISRIKQKTKKWGRRQQRKLQSSPRHGRN